MAWAQTVIDKASVSVISRIDSGGYWYFNIGPLRIYIGSGGSPNTLITAPMGSICCDQTTGQWYTNDDASTGWKVFDASID